MVDVYMREDDLTFPDFLAEFNRLGKGEWITAYASQENTLEGPAAVIVRPHLSHMNVLVAASARSSPEFVGDFGIKEPSHSGHFRLGIRKILWSVRPGRRLLASVRTRALQCPEAGRFFNKLPAGAEQPSKV